MIHIDPNLFRIEFINPDSSRTVIINKNPFIEDDLKKIFSKDRRNEYIALYMGWEIDGSNAIYWGQPYEVPLYVHACSYNYERYFYSCFISDLKFTKKFDWIMLAAKKIFESKLPVGYSMNELRDALLTFDPDKIADVVIKYISLLNHEEK